MATETLAGDTMEYGNDKYGQIVVLYSPAPGSGKTTIAKELELNPDYRFQRMSMADPIRELAAKFLELNGIEERHAREFFTNTDLKDKEIGNLGVTPRGILQTMGQEWGRTHVGEDVWVNMAVMRAKELALNGVDVVIDDCRYENEADAFFNLGATMLRVDRRLSTMAYNGVHGSEGNLNNWPLFHGFINNDYSIDITMNDVLKYIK